jgi:hypothetical protein
MRSAILSLVLLAAVPGTAFPARECSIVHKAMGWHRGKMVRMKVEERSEKPEGAAADGEAYGQVLHVEVAADGRSWAGQCAVGTVGCDPAALAEVTAASELSFVVLKKADGERIVLVRPDGHLLCARVTP